MIVDTSALLAFFDARDPAHSLLAELFSTPHPALVVSPFVVAELGYLVLTRFGVHAELQTLGELTAGAWELAVITPAMLREAVALVANYGDSKIGITDAVNVVLAQEYQTQNIATLDRLHYGYVRRPDGQHLIILPEY